MKKFELIGIKPPGRVNLPGMGTIDLCKIDDTLAEKLYRQGLPFIRPTAMARRHMHPKEKPMDTGPMAEPPKEQENKDKG